MEAWIGGGGQEAWTEEVVCLHIVWLQLFFLFLSLFSI